MVHYSKVMVGMPGRPEDGTDAVMEIECDVCGTISLTIPMAHVATVVDALTRTLAQRGEAERAPQALQQMCVPVEVVSDEEEARLRAYMDEVFPGWKARKIKGATP